jgi:hypothetical protein
MGAKGAATLYTNTLSVLISSYKMLCSLSTMDVHHHLDHLNNPHHVYLSVLPNPQMAQES